MLTLCLGCSEKADRNILKSIFICFYTMLFSSIYAFQSKKECTLCLTKLPFKLFEVYIKTQRQLVEFHSLFLFSFVITQEGKEYNKPTFTKYILFLLYMVGALRENASRTFSEDAFKICNQLQNIIYVKYTADTARRTKRFFLSKSLFSTITFALYVINFIKLLNPTIRLCPTKFSPFKFQRTIESIPMFHFHQRRGT